MVVVSHLFFFFENNLGADVTHSSHIGLCLELSISRHPPRQKKLFLMEMQKVVFLPVMQEGSRGPCSFLSL